MKMTESKHMIMLPDTKSKYFEQVFFVLKENVVCEDEKLLNEARCIVEKFEKRCEKGSNLLRETKKGRLSNLISAGVGAAFCGIVFLALSFF